MKKTNVFENTVYLKAFFLPNRLQREASDHEPPLRAELFSADQMEQHGKTLAARHKLHGLSPDRLLSRLSDNEAVLSRTCGLLIATIKANRRITPAGEWLLDNFYLIEEQIRTAKKHLPKGYSRELPRLSNGLSAGHPRVYDIALEAISHGDGRLDAESLNRFVAAYQSVVPLKLGELWAIPIMLRLALIENLRRVAVRISIDSIDRDLAESWADQMIQITEKDPKSLILIVADMARSRPPMVSSFVAELARRLQGQGPALALPLTWIEQRLSELGLTIEQLVQSETQQQARDQVSISNSIGSLRFLGAMDWREFVETQSIIEQTLRQDPDAVYAEMDFATRDHYRHIIEKLAKKTDLSEGDVARQTIELAQQAINRNDNDKRTRHVGFYLVSDGQSLLRRQARIRQSFLEKLKRLNSRFSLFLYLGAITLLTVIPCLWLLPVIKIHGSWDSLSVLTLILTFLSSSQLAIALVNWLATLLVNPEPLPKLDFSRGVPKEFSTLVIVPTMLTSAENIDNLIEALEVRFLANRGDNLYFGLLTDFKDADKEALPGDEQLLELACKQIDELNNKYCDATEDCFFLFHRPRRWNQQEKIWMGYERKRGKLADLNAFLRGQTTDRFSVIAGNTKALSEVKYVITLDTDTQLPRESARQFVGAMAHPLNHAFYDEKAKRVTRGYGILQPRVSASLPGANRSLYARLAGNDPGIDPYTRTISNVYQDLFQEGSFIGKGIYDIDAFERSLKGRFPENQILSHDLLEGCYARSGLLSDVQLYEEYPALYNADVSRRHRWVRGDWQIMDWILPAVPGPAATSQKNCLSLLSRWKIFDNLRRSLSPIALTLLLILGWTILSPAWLWTTFVIAIIMLPPAITSISGFLRKADDVTLSQHLFATFQATCQHFIQAAFNFVCLPYEAYSNLDAIVRTCVRMAITHKNLLEWNTSSDAERSAGKDFISFLHTTVSAPLAAICLSTYLVLSQSPALAVAWPVLCLWLACPLIAWWVSLPIAHNPPQLTLEQITFLQSLARKTWAFFEIFVGEEDNWLPPDNYQEDPVGMVAHRTSPTNIGLSLLANLAAYDFGYICAGQLIERTENTFKTMQSLDRHRGHFYNWYDTQTLKPLLPTYVSTVDSGNLAASLLTLRPGLVSLSDDPILPKRFFNGLHDTVLILDEACHGVALMELSRFQVNLESAQDSPPQTLNSLWQCLRQLVADAQAIEQTLEAFPNNDANAWAKALVEECSNALNELLFLAPWATRSDLPTDSAESAGLNEIPTLRKISDLEIQVPPDIKATPELKELLQSIKQGSRRARERITTIERLAFQANEFAQMEYDFLFDKTRLLMAIGYHVNERRLDASYYDLLASEARLSNFIAIAQGQLPQESWFALGRLLTTAGSSPVLLSWSGSMFEYLMPLLVMPTYENTLLDKTYKAVIESQMEYGRQRGVPWGISESGYNTVDVHQNYQYRAFGVPGLGLKRGLAEDLVIAPYATVLALMVAPEDSCHNLERLAAENFIGRFGFYEAIDYTSSRLPRDQEYAVIRSFMAHHQGMSFLSLAYLLLNQPMQKRFESDPSFQATLLLLQERVPKVTDTYSETTTIAGLRTNLSGSETPVRVFQSPNTLVPEVQLLSNGKYHVMVTSAGGGYSLWKDIAVTRWREDSTLDNWGSFCYIRDLTSKEFWSIAHQPTLKRSKNYEAIFSESRVEFRRSDHDYDTHSEIVVSSEDDIELRRVHITNRSSVRRTIDITSYAEVVLTQATADALHPSFSNLFVQTEILAEQHAILCNRRPRSDHEHTPWLFHLLGVHGAKIGKVSYETDRMRFVGRGNTPTNPQAMKSTDALSDSQGSVLDPIVAIRYQITLDPEQSATINIVTGIGETRDACLSLVEKYHDRGLADRVFDLAWTHSQVVLRQLNATEADAQLYGSLASSIIYANPLLRADAGVITKNRRGQSGLWGYAISGDLPIILLQIKDPANIELVRQLVQAHAYWRLKGLAVDLVIWNDDHAGYRQQLQEQIMAMIAAGTEASTIDRPGGIFVRPADQISAEDRILLQAVARAIITDSNGSLEEQIERRGSTEPRIARLVPSKHQPVQANYDLPYRELILFNGLGGFTADGREYVIMTKPGQVTPAPWVNVLANPHFGSVISESGSAYTWSGNAHEFRLTPWDNDPVCDSSGEAFYLRDEETGALWSPTPLPARGTTPYVSRHGFGYSVFEHTENGITSELWVYVALDAPIKFSVLKVRNNSGRTRRLSATGYVEWVLGDLPSKSNMHTMTEIDPKSGALCARNSYNSEFADRVAFFDVDDISRTISGDRTEFLGRNGTLHNPSAMSRLRLSGKVGPAYDPCAAIQVPFELADGQEREIIFRLGAGRDADDASNLIHRFRGSFVAREALQTVFQHWKHVLGTVNIETPDPSLNVLANGWLLYQTIACRLWARSGYYQSGGAFGFRDQLQDVMALVHAEPGLLREQLLLCASRQFKEGDVQHWWHPPLGRGVRTHCSDDYLWLPLATCRYVLSTGDTGVLDQSINFLEGRLVNAEEDSYYDLPIRSEQAGTLYEHCVRAILRGLNFGIHGLPLMGSGDWNDGMNLVGIGGKGESVWLGFFLYDVLLRFTKIAHLYGDAAFAERCMNEAAKLRKSIERDGWDGKWYRRAYFDDGTPLGSAKNAECQIDAIAQSWSVLSGAGDSARARLGMQGVDERLVRRKDQLIQLLDPPFNTSTLNPGYIKGYVPGVRENGGQYTHGAIWTVMAFAALGKNERAWELLSMINPVNHGSSPEGIATYKVEPYVVAADVYAVSPHTGRGGWTWYTGSAGWMYRLILESLLGLKLDVDKLHFAPCLPASWQTFKIHYRHRETVYHITVSQIESSDNKLSVFVDGVEQHDGVIHLNDDRHDHTAEVKVYKASES